VRALEDRQGTKISCLEEIAFYNRWILKEQLLVLAAGYKGGPYGKYLMIVAEFAVQNTHGMSETL
jgi:glucose-1-phosphate thymidylyltransferase